MRARLPGRGRHTRRAQHHIASYARDPIARHRSRHRQGRGGAQADTVLTVSEAGIPLLFIEVDNCHEPVQKLAAKVDQYMRFFQRRQHRPAAGLSPGGGAAAVPWRAPWRAASTLRRSRPSPARGWICSSARPPRTRRRATRLLPGCGFQTAGPGGCRPAVRPCRAGAHTHTCTRPREREPRCRAAVATGTSEPVRRHANAKIDDAELQAARDSASPVRTQIVCGT
ncbi:replication-relaxation family protein [Streptomyces sp. N2A]|uniref:replication-relaxation family protein n=1 Tax=Streptomyces sp. N2A TaxID=3073936 RepID=UPI0028701E55|nr:replication-relaxation family protein [Streptomyces sp. N2A]